MPFVQIYVGAHLSPANKKDISMAIHQGLMTHFLIPEKDYFQVIHVMQPEDLLYPDSYFDVPHSNNLIYIRITARSGRTVEMKQALYKSIASRIAATTPVSENDVVIILVENELPDWSFGQGVAQMVGR
ncbi:tautomerase-like protein [Chitinophaga polysaccharea]|uniref:Tautomerase-like protein n=1 Tax=Chitinophaga polysaccharea TaxID=1293035 RepID=A0A561PCJ5_9BACT|nr:tautomerase family protein [Chitinophaga polysaccharea]TWF35854.1 tautomerase-like protein [Chitinophaga polysaccharea]